MIEAEQIIPLLLEACPSFRGSWDEHTAWWGSEEAGHYNDVGCFAEFMVDRYKIGELETIAPAFDVIERVITGGTEQSRGIVIVGLLESLQTRASHEEFGYRVFEQWLGQRSLDAWRELEQVWRGKGSLMDVIREQKSGGA